MLYEFNESDALQFAYRANIKTRDRGNNIEFSICPYCHGGKKPDKFTFAINKSDGRFNCLRGSCGVHGNMITLARDFPEFQLNEELTRYYNIGNANNKYRQYADNHRKIETRDKAVEFCKSRGISEEICRKYEITTKKDDENIIVFPFKDETGALTFTKYRNANFKKGESYGSKEWCDANRKPILFGMNHIDRRNKTLVITEGQMDSLAVAEAGISNVVSVPFGKNGFTWIPHCWDFVNSFDELVVFGDYENGEISLLDMISKRFDKTIKYINPADYLGEKDANDILLHHGPKAIVKAIKNAVPVAINHVVPLQKVKGVNVNDIEKMPTGFDKIDKMLCGGLPFGGLTLIGGKAGEGKSTLASQLVCKAIDEGYSCFCYSGELGNSIFQDWIEKQMAGPKFIVSEQTLSDYTTYKIKKEHIDRIRQWYADRLYIYDSSVSLEDDETNLTLLKIVEKVINQFGCRVILIDNLMTALELEPLKSDDKYDKQSRFVKKLAEIAVRYNVLIMLVAHKRKNSTGVNDNDDFAGSSDIGNLAQVVVNYGKDKKGDGDLRRMSISKNRLFGKVSGDDAIWTRYDDGSRRVYVENQNQLNFEFGWVTEDDYQFEMAAPEEVPF